MTPFLLDMGDGTECTLENVRAVKAAANAFPGETVMRVRVGQSLCETVLRVDPGPQFLALLDLAVPVSWDWPGRGSAPAPKVPPPARRPPPPVRR